MDGFQTPTTRVSALIPSKWVSPEVANRPAASPRKLVAAQYAKHWMKDEEHAHCAVCQAVFKNTVWIRAKQSVLSQSEDGSDAHTHTDTHTTVGVQRHHCRCCGEVVCNLCSLVRVLYTDKKLQRTCLHCVLRFEMSNLSDAHRESIVAQVRTGLSNLQLSDEEVRVQDIKPTIEALLNLTESEKKTLRMENMMQKLATEISNVSPSLSLSLPLEEFTTRFFLYPYLMKRYQVQLLHLRRDIESFRLRKHVSLEAMQREHVYPRSAVTLRLLQCIVENDLEGVREAIAQGANLLHRVHLACSNYSVLDLKRNLLETHSDTHTRKLDWRWVNFFNVRDIALHSSLVDWDTVVLQSKDNNDKDKEQAAATQKGEHKEKEKKPRISWPFGGRKEKKEKHEHADDKNNEKDSPPNTQTHKDSIDRLASDDFSASSSHSISPLASAEQDVYFRESNTSAHEDLIADIVASREMGEETAKESGEPCGSHTEQPGAMAEKCSPDEEKKEKKNDEHDSVSGATEIDQEPLGRSSLSASFSVPASSSFSLAPARTNTSNTNAAEPQRTESRYRPISDHHGNTALHFAVACHHLEIVKELLTHPEMRRRVHFRNEEGLTPVQIAKTLYPRSLNLFRSRGIADEKDLLQLLTDN